MNYELIHDKMVAYLRNSSVKDRILQRNPLDDRLKLDSIYTEIHHIIPRSLGGLDEDKNTVVVLPEEHIFLHMLRYKIYRKREDALAVRFMLNGFDSEHIYKEHKIILNKKIRMGYSWLRTHAQFLRQTEGWQTPDGRRRISEARKGMMPAKDALTGEMVGAVEVDHPNVVSGKWVHHTKGRKQSEREIQLKKEHGKGQNNPNASGLSEEYFIEKGLEMFGEFGIILSWDRMLGLSKSRGFKWIKSLKSRFNGLGRDGYYKILEEKTGTKFDGLKSKTISKRGIPLV